MARLELATPRGRLVAVGADERELARVAEIVRGQDLARPFGAFVEVGAVRAYLKHSRLFGKARLRWGAKRALGIALPRLAELANLEWLRGRLFQAPRPIAAGYFVRGGLPCSQFLATEEVGGATTLARWLAFERDAGARGEGPAAARAVLDELAREVARMHALRFVHRDLFPRNVLVGPRDAPSRVHFLDCWAGGAGPGLRGGAYDLACLFARGDERLDDADRERLAAVYLEERAALGRPVERGRFLARVERDRAALEARVARERAALAGRAARPAG